jgi:hypothetical protein
MIKIGIKKYKKSDKMKGCRLGNKFERMGSEFSSDINANEPLNITEYD